MRKSRKGRGKHLLLAVYCIDLSDELLSLDNSVYAIKGGSVYVHVSLPLPAGWIRIRIRPVRLYANSLAASLASCKLHRLRNGSGSSVVQRNKRINPAALVDVELERLQPCLVKAGTPQRPYTT